MRVDNTHLHILVSRNDHQVQGSDSPCHTSPFGEVVFWEMEPDDLQINY